MVKIVIKQLLQESRNKNLNADKDIQIITLSPRPQTAPIRRRLSASVTRKPRKSKTNKAMNDDEKLINYFQDVSHSLTKTR